MLASLPLLLNPFIESQTSAFALVTLLRLGRFLRFIRIMRFVPNAEHIWTGILRSLRASVSVFLVLLFLNLSLSMGATMLFGEIAPEYFGNPLISIYSLFKVFTVEGWYEIPDALAEAGASTSVVLMLRLYFMVSVLIGGILGLSLANAVFVDEMILDNNDDLEEMVKELRAELQQFRTEFQQLHQLDTTTVNSAQDSPIHRGNVRPNPEESSRPWNGRQTDPAPLAETLIREEPIAESVQNGPEHYGDAT
ncbi:ion transporter [Chloroflexi bacterium TSY]|nr:ion transporter [Chloroflexi bacterium TSY]